MSVDSIPDKRKLLLIERVAESLGEFVEILHCDESFLSGIHILNDIFNRELISACLLCLRLNEGQFAIDGYFLNQINACQIARAAIAL